MTVPTEKAEIRFILALAKALHRYGTPAYRLEEALEVVGDKLGLDAQFFSTPTSIFASFGLHKTSTNLEVMRQIGIHRPCLRLIILPLGVRQEFTREAAKRFTDECAVDLKFIRSNEEIGGIDTIYMTNYESVREGKVDVSRFGAASLDEASVLRSYGSKTYQEFLPMFENFNRALAAVPPDARYLKQILADETLHPDCLMTRVATAQNDPQIAFVVSRFYLGPVLSPAHAPRRAVRLLGHTVARDALLGRSNVLGSPSVPLMRIERLIGWPSLIPI